MTGLKTIVVTWTDDNIASRTYRRAVLAAFWCAEGNDADLNDALAYVARENRRGNAGGRDMRVHTFDLRDYDVAKSMACRAHRTQAV